MANQQRDARGRGRSPNSTATRVYERVRTGGERYWTLSDFRDLPATAVAHALSRLAGQGELQRLRKGLYYRPKQTVIGPSMPSAAEFATPAAAAPSALRNATVHTRRPASRFELDTADGALLELLRDRARYSDLSPQETMRRLVSMLADRARFKRLAKAALSEPPRVRAMLGALGEQADAPAAALKDLRKSLNPISRFDFGVLAALPNAHEWQAR